MYVYIDTCVLLNGALVASVDRQLCASDLEEVRARQGDDNLVKYKHAYFSVMPVFVLRVVRI
jgi:hypothetical protein